MILCFILNFVNGQLNFFFGDFERIADFYEFRLKKNVIICAEFII